MIPTRLQQRFNNGIVVGFNSTTGSVIVVNDYYASITGLTVKNMNQQIQDSLAQFEPGYTWPSIQDLKAFDPSFIHLWHDCTLCTSDVNGDQVVLGVPIGYSQKRHFLSKIILTKGDDCTVTPVMRINGSNCDLYNEVCK